MSKKEVVKKAHVRVDITGDNCDVNDAVTAVVADALRDVLPSVNIDLYNTNPNYNQSVYSRSDIRNRLIKAAENIEAVRLISVNGPYLADQELAQRLIATAEGLPQIHRHIVASAAEVPPAPAPGRADINEVIEIKNADVTVVEHCPV